MELKGKQKVFKKRVKFRHVPHPYIFYPSPKSPKRQISAKQKSAKKKVIILYGTM